MAEMNSFLESTVQRLTEADTALHSGDPGPPLSLWSRTDPVTLFGAAVTRKGWKEIGPTLEFLATRFSKCKSVEYEVLAAGSSGDLAYIVGLEHIDASVGDGPPVPYTVRVTILFRQESGEWKVIHRHGDLMEESGPRQQLLSQFDGVRPSS